MLLVCSRCGETMQGGMTLVRHYIDIHHVDEYTANDEVDDVFRKLNGTLKMGQIMDSGYMTVPYQYLGAKECEQLKNDILDRMDKGDEFTWGTTGPKRDEELQKYSIKNLSTQHLENILITQPHVDNELAAAILMLLKKRYGAL